jgi:hypothetical protein
LTGLKCPRHSDPIVGAVSHAIKRVLLAFNIAPSDSLTGESLSPPRRYA